MFFTASAGSHTLGFTTDVRLAGDAASFIDDVVITQNLNTTTSTPEPASLALVATGLISIAGLAARRKRNA